MMKEIRRITLLLLGGILLGAFILPSLRADEEIKISLDLKDTDIVDILHLIHRKTDVNIVIGRGVEGKVTAFFRNVPLDQALEKLVRASGNVLIREGKIYQVQTRENAEKVVQTERIPLKYISLDSET